MSNVATGLVQRRKVGSPTRKAVLMFMAGCASDDGSGVWTSKANMAADLEMGRRTVQNCVDSLIADGLISNVGKRACRNGFTIEYRVNLDAISAIESTRAGDAPVREVHVTRAGDAPQDVQDVHPNLPRTIHEPSEEPLVVPQPKKRASAIPENWVPSDENIAHAISKQLSEREIKDEADKFRDHHLAKGTTFKDWNAGWRTWVANAIKFGNCGVAFPPATRGRGQGGSIASVVARRHARG